MRAPIPIRLALLLLCALVLGGCGNYTFRGGTITPPEPAPDFALTDHNGQPFRLSEHQGKVTLIFFGFTFCPDVCPTALADMRNVRRELGRDAEGVQVLFITVDPERDTPERLKTYVGKFDPTFVGLHGTAEQLAPVFKDYGVLATKRELPGSALKYTMDHSAFTYVIDKAGRWRLLFSHGALVDDMVSDLRHLVREDA
ncbi:MAG TPA: SCO family protein [Roseiflexaceae bacterium]|nr:SCO family protein [Roseiflexaceae bacterium]